MNMHPRLKELRMSDTQNNRDSDVPDPVTKGKYPSNL